MRKALLTLLVSAVVPAMIITACKKKQEDPPPQQGGYGQPGYQGGYGNRTIITLEDGTDVWYCHQSRIAVSAGEQVDPGQIIGFTGSTGNVTGPHLHLEIHPGGGGPVDPVPVLAQHGVRP